MNDQELLRWARKCVDPDGDCKGCPFDRPPLSRGFCAADMIRALVERAEKLSEHSARYAEELAVIQERERWISVEERLPENWQNPDGETFVNYMIYSPDFGVDIGNFHAKAKRWICMGLPAVVTHWKPLPEAPEEDE